MNPASRSTAGGHRKIQRRLAVKLAVFTILVATVIGSMSSAIEIRNIFAKTSQEIIRSAEQLIELTLGAAAESVYQLDAEIAEDLLYGLMNNEFFVASAIHDELGNELASVSRPRSELTGMVGLIEIPLKEFRYDLPVRGDQSLAGVFTATLDVQSGLAPFYDLAIMTGIAQIFQTIGLALLVFFIAMCLVTTPLSKLARELAGIEPGSEDRLSVSDSHRNDELGRLADSANGYLEAASRYNSELVRSGKTMQAILDSLDEGVITATRDGVISGANVAAETMFGYDEDQAVGVRLSDLIVGNGDATIEKLLESTPSAKTGVGIELTGKRIDGREFPIELSVTSIDLFDGLRSLWTIRDNSERAQAEQGRLALEEQLRQSQKMEAIGTLAGGIAHDFNNMLGGIIGFAELAAEEAPKNSAIGGYLENVLSVSGQAVQLVKQILTFSRYQEEEKYVVELTRIIDECSSLIRQTIPSNIELVTEYRGASFTILANDTTMYQVIVNLYANAASAIGKHSGKIKLVLDYFDGIPPEDADQDSMARAVVDDQRRYVRMRLHDSGGGIPADILHRIFEPFFTTKDQGSGTGMGLAVVHSIIQNHSGWIEVDSADDGTTFTLYFPFVDAAPSFDDGESTVVLEESTGDERILVVDDNNMIADLLLCTLTRQGYEVVIAKSGEEALRVYRGAADTFDLVITDQTMPGMNGDELVVEIFSIRADQPVILCTGYSNIITEEYALSMGIRRYLLKPVAIRELCKSVRSVLDEKAVSNGV